MCIWAPCVQVLYLALGTFFVTLSAKDGSTIAQLDLG